MTPDLTRAARSAPPAPSGWSTVLGLGVVAVLLGLAGRYGYHRDEFYYLAAGRHPALGYVDQPPLTPLIARAEELAFGDGLLGLRLAPALATGLTVVLTGLIARELGARRRAQALAAATGAVAAFPVGTGHVLSTSTFDLLAWTALSWLLVRALRAGGPVWLAAGAVAGVGLENKALVLALPAAVFLGVLAVGPRSALAGRWPVLGALLAVALWAPNLVWQARHGWPQLAMAHQIATVGNGGSVSGWLFVPFQLVLVSPLLVPVWVAGLVALWRAERLRAFAVAYLVLLVALLAAGGKPYYLAGMYPLLLAAGAAPALRWARTVPRRAALGGALALSAAVTAVLMLPVLPAPWLAHTPIPAMQPIAAESIGWPEFAATVSAVYRALPDDERRHAVALTQNYGEAGALETFHDRFELPPAYSGQNAYADWGPPPESAGPVLAVGFDEARLRQMFGSVRLAARIDDGIGLRNQEQGQPVWVCRDRLASWSVLWPGIRRLA